MANAIFMQVILSSEAGWRCTIELAELARTRPALLLKRALTTALAWVLITRAASALGDVAARELRAAFVVGVIYQWYFLDPADGQTPGKRVMGIRVVKATGVPAASRRRSGPLRRLLHQQRCVFMLGWIWASVRQR